LALEAEPAPGLWKTERVMYGPEQLEFMMDENLA
jgi:hypothetical protein